MHASHTFFCECFGKKSIGNYTHFLYPQYGKRVDTSLRKIPSLERGYVREYFDQARKSNIYFENTEILENDSTFTHFCIQRNGTWQKANFEGSSNPSISSFLPLRKICSCNFLCNFLQHGHQAWLSFANFAHLCIKVQNFRFAMKCLWRRN